jgi:predicted glycoside hydrolase/deacetylase ChbG (UPF0249 family)
LSVSDCVEPTTTAAKVHGTGLLIVNADDWGRDRDTTDRIAECVQHATVSSVSAMVFMEDSERSAEIGRTRGVDAGLHLNFTTPFSALGCPARLSEHQGKISAYLRRNVLTRAIFHPGLTSAFEYVAAAQCDEFARLYGQAPNRLDGHHHMHLCANVVFGGLLQSGTIVRRNFSFQPGEKSLGNRLYRRFIDGRLARNHRLTDYFFSLPPLDLERLPPIFSLAGKFTVEMETHPAHPEEYKFLTGQEMFRLAQGVPIQPYSALLRLR